MCLHVPYIEKWLSEFSSVYLFIFLMCETQQTWKDAIALRAGRAPVTNPPHVQCHVIRPNTSKAPNHTHI